MNCTRQSNCQTAVYTTVYCTCNGNLLINSCKFQCMLSQLSPYISIKSIVSCLLHRPINLMHTKLHVSVIPYSLLQIIPSDQNYRTLTLIKLPNIITNFQRSDYPMHSNNITNRSSSSSSIVFPGLRRGRDGPLSQTGPCLQMECLVY